MDKLKALANREILELGIVISTPDALAAILKRRPEVADLRHAVDEGSVTWRDLREFVAALFRKFTPAKKFVGDVCLCALAVALETQPSAEAEGFLQELSRIRIRELPMSPRVATIALRNRSHILTRTTTSEFTLAHSFRDRVEEPRVYRVTSQHSLDSREVADLEVA